jgi:hypothetical protein
MENPVDAVLLIAMFVVVARLLRRLAYLRTVTTNHSDD